MQVIEFFEKYDDINVGLTVLEENLGIKAKIYDDLFVLNYDQINSPKTDPIVAECRGLILDYNLNILCRPFDRFFNFGEAHNEKFDFNDSVCFEKADGSIIKVWYDLRYGVWRAGTRGTAYAESECNSGSKFIDLVENTIGCNVHDFMNNCLSDVDCTYIFELCTSENRVVTRYEKDELVLLGIRNNDSGVEYSLEALKKECKFMNTTQKILNLTETIRMPKIFSIKSIEQAHTSFDTIGPLDEGFVFYNPKTCERVKVKSPAYVAIHHLRDNGNINPKRVCELVFLNETDEYLTYFPEDFKHFEPWMNAFESFKNEVHSKFELFRNLESQKDYALQVKDFPYSGIMFALRQGKDMAEIYTKLTSDKKVELLSGFKG